MGAWLDFKMEPWESPNSPYFGASLAALAVGFAPEGYIASAENAERLKALRGYFQRQHPNVSLLNQLMGLWASSRVPDLLTASSRPPSTPHLPCSSLTARGGRWRSGRTSGWTTQRVIPAPMDTRRHSRRSHCRRQASPPPTLAEQGP